MSRYSDADLAAISEARIALNPAAGQDPPPDGGHVAYVCPGGEDHWGCMFCDGGLFACIVCGGLDGGLTTQCPGTRMMAGYRQLVYAGELDCRLDPTGERAVWVDGPSIHTPALWRLACERVGVRA